MTTHDMFVEAFMTKTSMDTLGIYYLGKQALGECACITAAIAASTISRTQDVIISTAGYIMLAAAVVVAVSIALSPYDANIELGHKVLQMVKEGN
jgi:hypothetical protein